ncbi:hypothetical protein EJP77_08825 [Paenibacillus zeisoli]|uniref:Spore coat protein n=1 Tax=Paenibacillus zeisoli TaxID=2496267 RepID=A0A433XI36_9BACL|nr:hypothetical protein [Paenibacillus zeisoli]RUT33726.1 hypothetical protein EJP77_08825 [Paenibacillus zeisoli]
MKWVTRIALIVLGTVLISGVTMLTTGYVVNAYVQSLLTSLNIKWEGQPSGFGGLLQGAVGLGSGTKTDKTTGSPGQKSGNTNDNKALGENNSGVDSSNSSSPSSSASAAEGADHTSKGSSYNDENQSDNPTDTKDTGDVPDNALPVMGSQSGEASTSSSGAKEDIVVTPDDLAAKKKELPDKDKEDIFQILMAKLPQSEMQSITASLEDGLTEAEMIQIQQIMSKYLDKSEYAKVMKVLGK